MKNNNATQTAIIYSAVPPTEEQQKRFLTFLNEKYGEEKEITLTWKKSEIIKSGFRLHIGSKIYDWSIRGRFRQLRNSINSLKGDDIISLMRDTVHNFEPGAVAEEVGRVESIGDGIVKISGLDNVTYGEILVFANGVKGMVQEIDNSSIGCILFDDTNEIHEGSTVIRTGKTAGMPVGEKFIGRVIDSLGNPIDGKGPIECDEYYPIERPAPGIIDRQSVNAPMETGILAIDSMFPIGRGQRELIIGDRQTGKTAIALDTIVNQNGKGVICIYVAIGQKASTVARITNTLKKKGAMDYSVVVCANASDSAPLQYIAPYSGCALAEYFMNLGIDVLIVYDDLSKHAIAYRSMSLLLGRSPGREAYPGYVFYLHSRLLERSAHLCEELGGGSMTALPIVETQAGDVSAYIPTNIISITDGQIFLENSLFFSGQRPAVNIGLSVSRVGSSAQHKAMKKATANLRLELAQYREMEVFTQFASDLDDETKNQLTYGAGLMRMLRQKQWEPKKLCEQVIILITGMSGLFKSVEIDDMDSLICDLTEMFYREHESFCVKIDRNGDFDEDDRQFIIEQAEEFINKRSGR